MPHPFFTDAERANFATHWIPVTLLQLIAINRALPANVRVRPIRRQSDNQLFIGSDLLTDIGPGELYNGARVLLLALAVQAFTPDPVNDVFQDVGG